MNGILDRVSAQWHSQFYPQTPADYLALRLAQRLGEPAAAQHYRLLIDQYGPRNALEAYRRTAVQTRDAATRSKHFHTTLKKGVRNGHVNERVLMAAKVERRSVAVAVFEGVRLDYTQSRQLCSDLEKVEHTVSGFLSLMFRNFKIETAAMEAASGGFGVQRLDVTRMVELAFNGRGIPLARVEKHDLVASFAHPAPRSRTDMRKVVQGIWPVLNSQGAILDAVALGLYIQTERLFTHNA